MPQFIFQQKYPSKSNQTTFKEKLGQLLLFSELPWCHCHPDKFIGHMSFSWITSLFLNQDVLDDIQLKKFSSVQIVSIIFQSTTCKES